MGVRRNITRCVLNSSEITDSTSTPTSTAEAFVLTTSDSLYVGFKKPFAYRYFQLGTVNSNSVTLTVSYWDGSSWSDVKDLIDETEGFTKSGYISWQNQTDFDDVKLSPISDVDLYFVRIQVSASLSAGTTLQWVGNTYVTDALLEDYYPELIEDSRWLPPNETSFLRQYVRATDLVTRRLKADGIITDESQVIDPNEVDLAAAHAAAYIIVNGVARSEEERDYAKSLIDSMNAELNKVKLDLDFDGSGIIEEDEKNEGDIFIPRGGY